MIYILRDESGAILGYGERGDWVPAAGQTVEALDTTLDAYASRFRLRVDKPVIWADGEDLATVTLSTSVMPTPPSIDVLVNGTPETVALVNGVGTLLISAEVAGDVTVEPADRVAFCRAGEGMIIVRAEEG